MARQIEDELSHIQQLILLGKERGYLLYDEGKSARRGDFTGGD